MDVMIFCAEMTIISSIFEKCSWSFTDDLRLIVGTKFKRLKKARPNKDFF